MRAFVVIPCLNEENQIAATCHSLGFGLGPDRPPRDTVLVVADNNSTDATGTIVRNLIAHSPPGSFHLVTEPVRGYVPARHRGSQACAELASAAGWDPDDCLVLQADADTIYEPGYVRAMVDAAEGQGPTFLEGQSHAPATFTRSNQAFCQFVERVDNDLADLFAVGAADIIVDDKVCAYRLSDYRRWGGHRREFNRGGDEILAESTRLFIRAKLSGASKIKVNAAIARSSRRRVVASPAQYFATAGFPRGCQWRQHWDEANKHNLRLEDFSHDDSEVLSRLVEQRKCHLISIFMALPAVVASIAKTISCLPACVDDFGRGLHEKLGITRSGLFADTAPVFEELFRLIDTEPAMLLRLANQAKIEIKMKNRW